MILSGSTLYYHSSHHASGGLTESDAGSCLPGADAGASLISAVTVVPPGGVMVFKLSAFAHWQAPPGRMLPAGSEDVITTREICGRSVPSRSR